MNEVEEYAPKFIFHEGRIIPIKNKFYQDMKELILLYDEDRLSEDEIEKADMMIRKAQETFHEIWVNHKKELVLYDFWQGAKNGCDIE